VTTLVLTPDRDTPGRHDWRGAFQPESDAFMAAHGGVLVRIDQGQSAAGRFRQTLAAIEEHQPDTLAYFGHGLRRSLPQLGAGLGNVASLAAALALGSTAPLVVLYACSAADGVAPGGEGGFCDALRDALGNAEAPGCRVFGHSTAGHCCRNPYVRRFDARTNLGGEWLVAPGSPRWRAWSKALQGPMRHDFPYLTPDELAARLDD
jgi:hypothetical protein